jgi:two-component sensor histidine kinase
MSVKAIVRSPLFLATAGMWLLCLLVWTLDAAVERQPHQLDNAVRGFVCDAVGASLCGAIYWALRRLEGRSLSLRLLATLVLASLATMVFMAVLFTVYHLVMPYGPTKPTWLVDHLDTAVATLWTILACCGIYFSMGLGAALRDSEAVALDSQNRMLRYQLDPHFLFNIHSALATLIHDDRNAEAEQMVRSLSNFLRRSIEKDPAALAPLAEELAAMREYIGVEATRFGKRLKFVESVEPAVRDALAPSFILQPLLENAIKHGLSQAARPVTIELGAAREANGLKLWVQDDGAGKHAKGSVTLGVGLENVRSRLQTLYGSAASMSAQQGAQGGFRVELSLPLAFA